MKSIQAFIKELKSIFQLAIILAVLFLLCACSATENQIQRTTLEPEVQVSPILDEQTEPVTTEFEVQEDSDRSELDWKRCIVSATNFAIGTEFYVFYSDGTYCIYGTPAICSTSAFDAHMDEFSIIKSSALSEMEFETIKSIVTSIYTDGELIPIEEPDTSMYNAVEQIHIYVSVDISEDVFFLKTYTEWNGYPQKEYDALIDLCKSLDSQSSIRIP